MNITVLGSTGSIGVSTLDVVRQNPDRFKIHALVAGKNLDVLCSQILEFRPEVVVVADSATLSDLRLRLQDLTLPMKGWPELAEGASARVSASVASEVDFVMSAIVGVAGLEATYAAVNAKKRIGLANKEVLVASGALVMDAVRACGTELIPVDSEHNGAHQCFRAGTKEEVMRLLLTASGGPFRDTPKEKLWDVTPEQALNHPTWKMGRRITIDSATMMNKGFEVIEACWLFNLPPKQVDVVVHPQSSIHAMVEYNDGSVIAQVSATDMRMPIQYAHDISRTLQSAGSAPGLDAATHLELLRRPIWKNFASKAFLSGAGTRRLGHLHAQRGRRNCGGSLSRWPHSVSRHRPYGRGNITETNQPKTNDNRRCHRH